jgi:hypothetical protein
LPEAARSLLITLVIFCGWTKESVRNPGRIRDLGIERTERIEGKKKLEKRRRVTVRPAMGEVTEAAPGQDPIRNHHHHHREKEMVVIKGSDSGFESQAGEGCWSQSPVGRKFTTDTETRQ